MGGGWSDDNRIGELGAARSFRQKFAGDVILLYAQEVLDGVGELVRMIFYERIERVSKPGLSENLQRDAAHP